jgi:hypothetical protein
MKILLFAGLHSLRLGAGNRHDQRCNSERDQELKPEM